MRRLVLDGRVAVVTGAGSGIGRAIACSLAARGCHVALADIDETGLEATASLIGNRVRVTRHRLDVADAGAVARFPDEVVAAHGGVDVLVNNAGVALGGTFDQVAPDEFDWLMAINFSGVVNMTRAFLPHLKARPEAQLVNLSSLFGLIAPPGQTAYSAAKFAVRGFSQALRHELQAEGSHVGVTVVHPGGVRTRISSSARIARNAPVQTDEERRRFEHLLRMPPETAGEIIVRAVERRRPRVLVGIDAGLVSLLERLAPVSYWALLGKAAR